MPQHKDFSAWISIEDKKADEFNVEVSDDGRRVTCWIVSEVGKKFAICFSSLIEREFGVAGAVNVDGHSCGTFGGEFGTEVNKIRGWRTSQTTIKPFIFSLLQLTDDDLLLDTSASGSLGEISIHMWRMVREPRVTPYKLHCTQLPEELQLHERSKKLTSHHVKFGEEEEIPRPPDLDYSARYPDDEPMLTFDFKYRPLDILKANGIVPLTFGQKRAATAELETKENTRKDVEPQNASANRIKPSEKRPATAEPNVNDIKQEESAGQNLDGDNVFPDKIKALEEELNNLKRVYRQSTVNKAKRIKVEASSSKNTIQPGEVIDLT